LQEIVCLSVDGPNPPPQHLLSLRVDELLCHIAKGARAKFMAHLEALTDSDLPSILPPECLAARQKASTSRAKVRRAKAAKCAEYPGGQLASLRDAEAPMRTPLEWQILEEPLEVPDDSAQRIVAHAVAGGRCVSWGLREPVTQCVFEQPRWPSRNEEKSWQPSP
jgi:hypothetical protein